MSRSFGNDMACWEPGMPDTPIGIDLGIEDGSDIHLSLYLSLEKAEMLLADLREAVDYAKAHPTRMKP
jgi:hypothetical protein